MGTFGAKPEMIFRNENWSVLVQKLKNQKNPKVIKEEKFIQPDGCSVFGAKPEMSLRLRI